MRPSETERSGASEPRCAAALHRPAALLGRSVRMRSPSSRVLDSITYLVYAKLRPMSNEKRKFSRFSALVAVRRHIFSSGPKKSLIFPSKDGIIIFAFRSALM